MRTTLACLFAIAAALIPRAAGAQALWWGDYRFQGEYFSVGGDSDTFVDQQVNAHLRLPAWDWRLGSLDLGAGIYWDVVRGSRSHGSSAGLGEYDVSLNLFPLRPFPVTLYFRRDMRGGLGTVDGWSDTVVGARWGLRTSHLGSWWFNFEENRYAQGPVRSSRKFFRLDQSQRFGTTTTVLHAELQNLDPGEGEAALKLGWADYSTQTWFDGGAGLTTRAYLQRTQSAGSTWSSLNANALLNVPLSQTLHWQLFAQAAAGWTGSSRAEDIGLASTLDKTLGRWRFFGGVAADGSRSSGNWGDGTGSQLGVFSGATRFLGKDWQVTGDVALRTTSGSGWARATGGTQQVFHVGVYQGGGMSAWLSNLGFFFKDVSFERNLYEAFPPGYNSPELVALRQQYYERSRRGGTTFSLDVTHLSEPGGTADSAHLGGSLQFSNTLGFQLYGDWQRDQGGPVGANDARSLTLQTTWSPGTRWSVSIFGTAGAYSQEGPAASSAGGWFQQGRFSVVGANIATALFPGSNLRLTAQRFTSRDNGTYDQAWAEWDWSLRDLSLQVMYNFNRVVVAGTQALGVPGTTTHRVQINLMRLFRGNAF